VSVVTSLANDSSDDRQMKRGILVATLIMTAAGVASANLLTEESRSVSSSAVARYAPPAAEPAAGPPSLTPSPLATMRAPITQEQTKAAQKVSVEMRQAPVPLQVRSRATANAKLPTIDSLIATQSTDAKSADAKPTDEAAGDAGAAMADAFNATKAKAAIEADGYKGVTALRKGENGTWRAKAMRGKTEVMLTVDASGSVAAD
jgi:hypothetical protein